MKWFVIWVFSVLVGVNRDVNLYIGDIDDVVLFEVYKFLGILVKIEI